MAHYAKLTPEEKLKRADLANGVIKAWNGGRSSGRIAAITGFTRNAVVGIVSRARAKGAPVRQESEPRRKPRRIGNVGRPPGTPPKAVSLAPVRIEAGHGVNHDTRHKLVRLRDLPPVAPLAALAQPSDGLWVELTVAGAKNCRYTEDGRLFCNRPGFPYCAGHRAVTHLPIAQKVANRRIFV